MLKFNNQEEEEEEEEEEIFPILNGSLPRIIMPLLSLLDSVQFSSVQFSLVLSRLVSSCPVHLTWARVHLSVHLRQNKQQEEVE